MLLFSFVVFDAPKAHQRRSGTIDPASVFVTLFQVFEGEVFGRTLAGVAHRLEKTVGNQHRNVLFAESEIPGGFKGGEPRGQMAAEQKMPFLVVHRVSPLNQFALFWRGTSLPNGLRLRWASTEVENLRCGRFHQEPAYVVTKRLFVRWFIGKNPVKQRMKVVASQRLHRLEFGVQEIEISPDPG